MKITIYGAGAIGGYIAALLAQAGEEVSVIARGPHLYSCGDFAVAALPFMAKLS